MVPILVFALLVLLVFLILLLSFVFLLPFAILVSVLVAVVTLEEAQSGADALLHLRIHGPYNTTCRLHRAPCGFFGADSCQSLLLQHYPLPALSVLLLVGDLYTHKRLCERLGGTDSNVALPSCSRRTTAVVLIARISCLLCQLYSSAFLIVVFLLFIGPRLKNSRK
ncbi:hypothetical protein Vretifemale_5138 [Volvox reticuliferus]|uniref:Uncharacterized protein n=1 Tax=Volvox reticuliferus TaxID=1737510 RepID=A0A8J4FHI4_9CHLO|nr:hypothetical protein Vretifemale_5138 [Volvox reticuliferus]